MALLKQFWTADAVPENKSLTQLLYEIRKDDADGQIYDAVEMSDIEAFAGEFVEQPIFDALITPFSKLERKMNIMLSVMKSAAQEVKPTSVTISKPFKKYNSVQVGVVFTLSDEQTITVFFHNPDTTPTKLAPTDDLVSWKWMLNKKDVTIIVAPEHGKDLNVREVARRLMKIAEKNSAAFLRQNANLKARKEQIEKDAKEVEELEKQLAGILDEIKFLTEDNAQRRENIKVLTEKVEAEKAAQEKAEQERLAAEKAAAEKAAQEKAEQERLAAEKAAAEKAVAEKKAAEEKAKAEAEAAKKAAEEKAKAEEEAKKAAEEAAKKAEAEKTKEADSGMSEDEKFLRGIIDGSIDANEQGNMDRLEKIAEAHDSESDPLMPLLNDALNALATQTVGKATSVLAA